MYIQLQPKAPACCWPTYICLAIDLYRARAIYMHASIIKHTHVHVHMHMRMHMRAHAYIYVYIRVRVLRIIRILACAIN